MMPVTLIQSGRFPPPGGGNYSFTNSEAAALVARMSSAPDDTRKGVIDTAVGALKSAGLWSKLDALYLFAAHDSQAALLSWISSTFDATASGAPTFTTDRGFTGATGKYIATPFNPSTASSPHFVQNSASYGVWSRTSGQRAAAAASCGAANKLFPRWTDDRAYGWANTTGGTGSASNTNGSGLFSVSRTTGSATKVHVDGSGLFTNAATSEALVNDVFEVLRDADASAWTGEAAAFFIGAGLSDAEAAALHTALAAYMTAVGA